MGVALMNMDSHKRGVLISGLASFFFSIALLYQMAPFFQPYAKKIAGASSSEVGLIFAALPLASFVFSIPGGKLIVRVGPKKALATGLLVLAVSSFMFGSCSTVPGWLFWRAAQGAATAPIYSSVSCMFAKTFPGTDDFAYVNGLQEAVANVGFAMGPFLGGLIFHWGGFFWPFGASAIGHVLFVAVSCFAPDGSPNDAEEPLVETDAAEEPKHAHVRDVLFGDIFVVLPACILVPALFGAADPLLVGHLESVLGDVDSRTVGMLMAIPSLPPIGLAVVVPMLMRNFASDTIILWGIMALIITTVGLGLTDPDSAAIAGVDVFPQPGSSSQWLAQIGLFLLVGLGSAFGWTPVLPDMMEKAAARVAAQQGISHEVSMEMVSPAVSSLFNGGAAIGEAAGPILGGMLYNRYGFAGTFLGLAFAFSVYFVVLLLYRLRTAEHPEPLSSRHSGLPSAPKLRASLPADDSIKHSTSRSRPFLT